jgi:arginase
MRILIVDVPYDCGQFNVRMGAGPTYLLDRGLDDSLRAARHDVRLASVRLEAGFHTEWRALHALQHQTAALVRDAVAAGERVILLSGNCATALLGAIGGLGARTTAVLWMDAHADFNTPETSPSGFLDGMAVAIAAGHCWREPVRTLRDVEAVPEEQIALVGVRDVDPDERRRLERSRVRLAGGDPAQVGAVLDEMPAAARSLYVHLDLDVVDPAELRANEFATGGGLSVDGVAGVIRAASARRVLRVAAITALDPTRDPERAWPVVERLARAIAESPADAPAAEPPAA